MAYTRDRSSIEALALLKISGSNMLRSLASLALPFLLAVQTVHAEKVEDTLGQHIEKVSLSLVSEDGAESCQSS